MDVSSVKKLYFEVAKIGCSKLVANDLRKNSLWLAGESQCFQCPYPKCIDYVPDAPESSQKNHKSQLSSAIQKFMKVCRLGVMRYFFSMASKRRTQPPLHQRDRSSTILTLVHDAVSVIKLHATVGHVRQHAYLVHLRSSTAGTAFPVIIDHPTPPHPTPLHPPLQGGCCGCALALSGTAWHHTYSRSTPTAVVKIVGGIDAHPRARILH